jgi:2-C-methyl-D-erythritol 4-phosphate cytidylyltransferase/2-C-methyl-D-erythritol 2,4-cyclodiphosphate synthase
MTKTGKASKIVALIMAAGSAKRFGGPTPKQYLCLNGISIIRRSIEAFLQHDGIDEVQVVIHPSHKKLYLEATEGLDLPPAIIGDKKQRQLSVKKGLEGIKKANKVLIHDAARPFVSKKIIDDVLKKLKNNDAVIPVIPVRDTLKKATKSTIRETVDRDNLFAVQTPQGFHFKKITQCHKLADANNFSDDAGLFEVAGIKVVTSKGDENNFKITTEEDFKMAKSLMKNNLVTKVGMGFDVHGFGRVQGHGHHIMLCGIPVVYEYELVGHSDGDVGLHAIVDALLGTISDGDIGEHFSPKNKKWKGADSAIFVEHAIKLLEKKKGIISHIDITMMAEEVRISPHRGAMRDRIAELLKIPKNYVSVKATTTDKLGFLGRGEGIAAQAVVTVQLPEED